MTDLNLNPNQMQMLEHLRGSSRSNPVNLGSVFSMRDDKNRSDRAGIGHGGYTDGNDQGEWLTEKGKKAIGL